MKNMFILLFVSIILISCTSENNNTNKKDTNIKDTNNSIISYKDSSKLTKKSSRSNRNILDKNDYNNTKTKSTIKLNNNGAYLNQKIQKAQLSPKIKSNISNEILFNINKIIKNHNLNKNFTSTKHIQKYSFGEGEKANFGEGKKANFGEGGKASFKATLKNNVIFLNEPLKSVSVNNQYTYIAKLNTSDDSLSYSIQNKPSWATFDEKNGYLYGSPTKDDIKTYKNIIISANIQDETIKLKAFDIEVKEQTNIALISNATQSSNYQDTNFYPNYAIDNNINTINITNKEINSWLQIEFPKKHIINQLKVLNRKSYTKRLEGSKLYITNEPYNEELINNTPDYILTSQKDWQKVLRTNNKIGKYVIIINPKNEYLHVSEVDIKGTISPAPMFSKNNYIFPIKKNTKINSVIGKIDAYDLNNSEITYEIKGNSAFIINSSGEIILTEEINNMEDIYNLLIIASNKSHNTISKVKIINDFKKPRTKAVLYGEYNYLPIKNISNTNFKYSIKNKPQWAEFNTSTGLLHGTILDEDLIGTKYEDIQISIINNNETINLEPFNININEAVNLSLVSSAKMGSTLKAHNIASNSIDSIASTYAVSKKNNDNWLEIKLPDLTVIKNIEYTTHKSHKIDVNNTQVYSSLKSYNVLTSNNTIDINTTNTELLSTLSFNIKQSVSFNSDINTKYLLLKAQKNRAIVFDEIKIYGITTGTPQFMGDYNLSIGASHNKVESFYNINAKDPQNDMLEYSILEDVPFKINQNGDLFVFDTLTKDSYEFTVKIDDGYYENTQKITINLNDEGQVYNMAKTFDSNPYIQGYLPNNYDEDNFYIQIDSETYSPIIDKEAQIWYLQKNTLNTDLLEGKHDLSIIINDNTYVYKDYIEIFTTRMHKDEFLLDLPTINEIDVNVNNIQNVPYIQATIFQANDVHIIRDENGTHINNNSFRNIKSILAQYTNENNESTFIKLNFSQTIPPFSIVNLDSFEHESSTNIVFTPGFLNSRFNFSGADCSDIQTHDGIIDCYPKENERETYITIMSNLVHFYNTTLGLNYFEHFGKGVTYNDINFIKRDLESLAVDYTYNYFFKAMRENLNTTIKTMSFGYSAEGVMGGTGGGTNFGDSTKGGWIKLFYGYVQNTNSRVQTYKTFNHELMHNYGFGHSSGLTYGWSDNLIPILPKHYDIDVRVEENTPKYIFKTKNLDNNKIEVTIFKTNDAIENNIKLEVLSSEGLRDIDIDLSKDLNSQNKIIVQLKQSEIRRFFVRVTASDSNEVQTTLIKPSDLFKVYFAKDEQNKREYYILNYDEVKDSIKNTNRTFTPANLGYICQAWLGFDSFIAYKSDIDFINNNYEEKIQNLNIKLITRKIDYKTYLINDYTTGELITSNITNRNAVIEDTNSNILCYKDY